MIFFYNWDRSNIRLITNINNNIYHALRFFTLKPQIAIIGIF